MIIDYLSDLHLDYYFPIDNIVEDAVMSIFNPIFTNNLTRKYGDVLIIAGDIGHHNQQNIEVLKVFKIYYKHIICVLGNHDYFLTDPKSLDQYENNSYQRADEMKNLISNEAGIYCLDGDVIEIDGIRFGGAMGWYDGAYIQKYFNPDATIGTEEINEKWNKQSSDRRFLFGVSSFDEIYKQELPKIEEVYKKCDVMITHYNPSTLKEHQTPGYQDHESTGFFCFDGSKFLQNGSMKYWLFGHTHFEIDYELENVKCLCNAFGYPNESYCGDWVWIHSIII